LSDAFSGDLKLRQDYFRYVGLKAETKRSLARRSVQLVKDIAGVET
jgi:hypothetical protein